MPIVFYWPTSTRCSAEALASILQRDKSSESLLRPAAAKEPIKLAVQTKPELVVTELRFSDLSGLEVIVELRRRAPNSHVVVLSAEEDGETFLAAVRSGIRGYVLKKGSSGELIEALLSVAQGKCCFSSFASDILIAQVQGTLHPGHSEGRVDVLSERERDVLRLVAMGRSNREIAKELDIGIYRLRSLRRTLMRKTGASNTASLTRLAMSTLGVGSIAAESIDPVQETFSR